MRSHRSAVKIQLEFAGVLLPVELNEKGQEVVPLKPIADLIGLDWETQRKKVNSDYLSKRLGTCTVLMPCAGQESEICIGLMSYAGQRREMTCIRLDRVAAYLNTINPERVRINGNESAADFLEKKHEEWDEVINAYEQGFGMFAGKKASSRKQPTVRDFLSVLKAKKQAETESERQVLNTLAQNLAEELGAPFQPELAISSKGGA